MDDGILVVVAKNDRAMRIEVGYGLEGAVPDAVAKRLIDEVFIPGFARAISMAACAPGSIASCKVIDGEPLPEPKQETGVAASRARSSPISSCSW